MASTTRAASVAGMRAEYLGDPQALPRAAQATLTRELYAVHCEIFGGVELDAFGRFVMRPPGEHRALHVFRDEAGRAVGYLSLHSILRPCLGRPAAIIRGAVGLLPAYRGNNYSGAAQARYILRIRLRYPLRRLYGFLCPVSPAMYAMTHRAITDFWPHPDRPTPPAVEDELVALGTAFGLGPAAHPRPGVYRVGWQVREPGRVDLSDPANRFYVQRNPDFAQGNGLALLCPLHLRNIIHGLRRVARQRRKRKRTDA